MEIFKDGSLDKTLLYLLKLTLTIFLNLWKFPKTGLHKTVLDILHLTITLTNLW